jgi:hypothetical protein
MIYVIPTWIDENVSRKYLEECVCVEFDQMGEYRGEIIQ